MGEVIIPVLLSVLLGPGTGQLYNRQFKKGGYLIGLSLIVLIAAAQWFRRVASPYLTLDLATAADPAALQVFVQNAVNHVVHDNGPTLYAYEMILTALWVYSIVDAYYGGVRRRSQLQSRKTFHRGS